MKTEQLCNIIWDVLYVCVYKLVAQHLSFSRTRESSKHIALKSLQSRWSITMHAVLITLELK